MHDRADHPASTSDLTVDVSEGHLLRAFLDTTADNVYFKDRKSRFIDTGIVNTLRISLANSGTY